MSIAPGLQIAWYYHLPQLSSDAEVDDLIETSLLPLMRVHVRTERPLLLAVTGTLLERVASWRPAVIDELRVMIDAGICEIAGTTYHEVHPPLVPARYLRLHVERDREAKRRLLGSDPVVFHPSNFAWTFVMGWVLARSGYHTVVLDSEHYRLATSTQLWRWKVGPGSGPETVLQETVVDRRELHRAYAYEVPGPDPDAPLAAYFRDRELVQRASFGTSGAIHNPLDPEPIRAVAEELRACVAAGGRVTLADDGDRVNPVSLAGYETLLRSLPSEAVVTVAPADDERPEHALLYLPSFSLADQWRFWLEDVDAVAYTRALDEIHRHGLPPELDNEMLELQDVFFLFWKVSPRKRYYLEKLYARMRQLELL